MLLEGAPRAGDGGHRHSLRLGGLKFDPPLMSPTGKRINALLEELGATINVSS